MSFVIHCDFDSLWTLSLFGVVVPIAADSFLFKLLFCAETAVDFAGCVCLSCVAAPFVFEQNCLS